MRLQVQLDEADCLDLLASAEHGYRHTGATPPDWLLMLIKAMRPQLAKAYKLPWKQIKEATKNHRLRSFVFDADGDPLYPES